MRDCMNWWRVRALLHGWHVVLVFGGRGKARLVVVLRFHTLVRWGVDVLGDFCRLVVVIVYCV